MPKKPEATFGLVDKEACGGCSCSTYLPSGLCPPPDRQPPLQSKSSSQLSGIDGIHSWAEKCAGMRFFGIQQDSRQRIWGFNVKVPEFTFEEAPFLEVLRGFQSLKL